MLRFATAAPAAAAQSSRTPAPPPNICRVVRACVASRVSSSCLASWYLSSWISRWYRASSAFAWVTQFRSREVTSCSWRCRSSPGQPSFAAVRIAQQADCETEGGQCEVGCRTGERRRRGLTGRLPLLLGHGLLSLPLRQACLLRWRRLRRRRLWRRLLWG